jgi:hypothetical protein
MNVINIGDTQVAIDEVTVQAQAGLAVCADGCPRAYAPPGSGLVGVDNNGNAGYPGHWFGVDTDNGLKTGNPIVQAAYYPNLDGSPSTVVNPTGGYWLSPTALRCSTKLFHKTDPRRYCDALTVRYLSIPSDLLHRPVDLGDVGVVQYGALHTTFVVGEVGPEGKLWEGSIELHRALGHDPVNPTRPGHLSGIDSGMSVTIYRGSSRGWPRTNEDIAAQVAQLMAPSTAD